MDQNLARAVFALAAAIIAWVVKEAWQARLRRNDAKVHQRNLVRALYAEIDFNTCDMEVFLERSPDEQTLKQKMSANPSLVPHITDARHTEIYRNKIAELHGVEDRTLSNMIHFFGMLEKIKMQIEGINYPSYQTLSVDGRMNGVMVIVRTSRTAKRLGLKLLVDMESDYPDLNLERFDRGVEPFGEISHQED